MVRPARSRAVLVVMLLGAAVSCRKYENSADYCERDVQCSSTRCDVAAKKCVPPGMPDGGVTSDAGGASALGGRPATGGVGGEAGTGTGGLAEGGASGDEAGRSGDADGGVAGAPGVGGGAGQSAPGGIGGAAGPDGGVDTKSGCSGREDCAATPATPVCDSASGMCVGCLAASDCTGATPACNLTSRTCVECLDDIACTFATKPFCGAAGACVACAQAPVGAGACAKKDATHPACGATGACLECAADADCHDATKPFCGATTATCLPCSMATAGACAKKDAAHPACGATGACLECAADTDCHDATKPFCGATGSCAGCGQAPAGAGACAKRDPAKPVCAASGTCVTCVTNADCAAATPVCSSPTTCSPCTRDSDCAGRAGPGICLTHAAGRCATEAETIYVQNVQTTTTMCSDIAPMTGGTSAAPFCTLQPAVAATAAGIRDLIIVRAIVTGATDAFAVPAGKTLSVVGQMSAVIGGVASPAFHLASGEAYLRDLKLGSVASIGCQADPGSTLRLDHLTVTQSTGGGILLDGAAFEIRDTTVTSNGPASKGAVTWGGIFANNPPAAGPKVLDHVTVQNNLDPGVTCTATVMGTGILASSNVGGDIVSACGFTSCAAAGPDCGAR